MSRSKLLSCYAAVLATLFAPIAVAGQGSHGGHGTHSGPASMPHVMHGPMRAMGADDPHMEMSPKRPVRRGDRERAYELAVATRRAIRKYKDVALARAHGYRPFGDTPEAKHVHFVHLGHSIRERWGIDPQRPGSLLYDKKPDGSFELVGAMYAAPQSATWEELDQRVPLSQTRWHLHTNICSPFPIWDREKWAQREPDGRPVYGPFSRISTREDCDRVG